MKRLIGVLWLLLAAGSWASAAPRVALVVGGRGDGVRAAIDLATVKVSKLAGLELVERSGIERILAEQKLTLAGLAEAGQAITAGKLLSADVLAVVEVSQDGKQTLGLVVFDAKTGLRLWDTALPAGGVEKEADEITKGIQAAMKKYATGVTGLRTVGFVAVRNADLPRSMDSLAESLALIVERRLASAPAVGVLERQRLEAVTGERALPTQAAERALLGSLVQLDLEIRRGKGDDGLHATILLTDSKGKQIGKFTTRVKEGELNEGATTLANGVCRALKATPGTAKGDPSREASRFQAEAVRLWSFKASQRALRAAESAHALDPADPARRSLLARHLMAEASRLLHPDLFPGGRRLSVKPDTVVAATSLMRRGLALRALLLSDLQPKNAKTIFADIQSQFNIDTEMHRCLTKVAALDSRLLNAKAKGEVKATGEEVERWLCREYLETIASVVEREAWLLHAYTIQLGQAIHKLRLVAPNAQHFTRKLIQVTERWLEVVRKLDPRGVEYTSSTLLWVTLTYATESAGHTIRWSPGPQELDLLDELFIKMGKHPHPVIRFQGRCGPLWSALLRKKRTAQDCYKDYRTAKGEFLFTLDDPKKPAPQAVVLGYFAFMGMLCSWDSLKFREAGHVWDERYDLWQQMLDRKMMLDNAIQSIAFVDVPPPPNPARKLALLDRTIALIDTPRFPYYGGDKQATKGNLHRERIRFLTKYPELAGKKAPVPWESAQLVLDLMQMPDIREFKRPTVVGDEVYVTGLGAERGREFIQPFRVPLKGGIVHPLGKTFLTWRRRPFHGTASAVPQKITGCQADSKNLYISTRTEGIYTFPLKGGPGRRLDDKLPSEAIESLALYDGRLYAGLEGGYLISLDPVTRRFDVLASSRRREKVTPFDDGEAFTVPYLAADPDRRRLLFLLQQGRSKKDAPHGLWSFTPKTNSFKRLLATAGVERALYAGRIREGRLLLSARHAAMEIDLVNNKHTLLWSWDNIQYFAVEPKTALCQEKVTGGPPQVFHNGWLWTSYPFARLSIARKKHEFLMLPQRKGNVPAGSVEVCQLIGKDRLLLGTSSVLWLLTLRKE